MGNSDVSQTAGAVTLTLSKAEAEHMQDEISDLLCWLRGYQAASSEFAREHAPMGIEGARRINIALKRALILDGKLK